MIKRLSFSLQLQLWLAVKISDATLTMQTDHLWDADAKTACHLILLTLDTWDT